MEFDKAKVYTALNADELKVGSKVICAPSVFDLKERVDKGEEITEVHQILDESAAKRIEVYFGDSYLRYSLAYLISEPDKEKFKWTDWKPGDVIKQKDDTKLYLVTRVNSKVEAKSHIRANKTWIDDDCLCYWEKVEE